MSRRKKRSLIPNGLTILNIVFGFSSIIYAIDGRYHVSVFLIGCAIIVDALDGFLSRKLGVESKFGKELDSLCDFGSFCIAPAILVHLIYDGIGFVVVVPPIFGAIRLARFNVESPGEFFIGLPTPIAGGLLAAITLIESMTEMTVSILLVTLSLLMVSNIQFKTFKSKSGGLPPTSFLCVLATGFLVLVDIKLLFIPFLAYMLVGVRLSRK